jgi:hypothetical protein
VYLAEQVGGNGHGTLGWPAKALPQQQPADAALATCQGTAPVTVQARYDANRTTRCQSRTTGRATSALHKTNRNWANSRGYNPKEQQIADVQINSWTVTNRNSLLKSLASPYELQCRPRPLTATREEGKGQFNLQKVGSFKTGLNDKPRFTLYGLPEVNPDSQRD